jgi:threonine dehydrogenase-like Zn-dependent dehydrogenase
MTDGIGVDAALECVGTGQSMTTAFSIARVGSIVGAIGARTTSRSGVPSSPSYESEGFEDVLLPAAGRQLGESAVTAFPGEWR